MCKAFFFQKCYTTLTDGFTCSETPQTAETSTIIPQNDKRQEPRIVIIIVRIPSCETLALKGRVTENMLKLEPRHPRGRNVTISIIDNDS